MGSSPDGTWNKSNRFGEAVHLQLWINKGPVGWWCDTTLELLHTAGIQEGGDYNIQKQQPFYKSAAFFSVSVQTVRDVSPSRDPAAQSSS